MSNIHCTSSLTVNDDQSATITMDLCNVCYKTIQTHFADPTEWVNELVKASIAYRAENIYRRQLEKHFTEGTTPENSTKESIILSYEHDPSKPLPP